jgi:hypothetical protein
MELKKKFLEDLIPCSPFIQNGTGTQRQQNDLISTFYLGSTPTESQTKI